MTDPGVVVSGGPVTLPVGAVDSVTFTGVYTVTQADIDAGSFASTATVAGVDALNDPVNSISNEIVVVLDGNVVNILCSPIVVLPVEYSIIPDGPAPVPALNAFKSASPTSITAAQVGDIIDYTILVTNTGDVDLTGVTVSDPNCTPTLPGNATSTSLVVNASATWTCSYPITQADIDAGNVSNTATASSVEGATDSSQVNVSVTATCTPAPNILGPQTFTFNAGDTMTFGLSCSSCGQAVFPAWQQLAPNGFYGGAIQPIPEGQQATAAYHQTQWRYGCFDGNSNGSWSDADIGGSAPFTIEVI